MTMFKKKSTKKSINDLIKEDGIKTEERKATAHKYLWSNDVESLKLKKWEIRIRLRDDGLAVDGNTTKEQMMDFFLYWLFHALDCLMNEANLKWFEKMMVLLKWNIEIDKLTKEYFKSDDDDDSDDND